MKVFRHMYVILSDISGHNWSLGLFLDENLSYNKYQFTIKMKDVREKELKPKLYKTFSNN